jgi:hypothetical protein
MLDRKFVEFLVVLGGLVLAMLLARTLAGGNVAMAILPLVVIFAIYLGFRFKTMLPAFAFGMMWYEGGSPFVKDVPYVYYAVAASVGIAFLALAMRHPVDRRVDEVPLLARTGMISLVGVVAIFVIITVLKKKGILSGYNYGAAGGVKYAVKYILLVLFGWLLFEGKIPLSKLNKIPHVALGVALFATLIDAFNYLSPQTVFITYYFTTDINFEVMDVLRGATESVLRLASFREFGIYLALFVIAHYVSRRKSTFSTDVPFRYLMGIGLGGLLVLMSGYRGFLIRFAVVVIPFFWIYRRKWAIVSLIVGAGIWGLAIAIGDSISVLPLPVQRVLGSLPGVYQTDVAITALGGIDWRAELVRRFFANEFWKHPWFGRGQVGDFWMMAETVAKDKILFFEVTQLWHSGLASALDMVGIIGAVLLGVAQLSTFILSISILRKYAHRLEGWMVWFILNFFSANINFWYTGFFHKNLPMMAFSMLGVFLVYGMLIRDQKEAQKVAIKSDALSESSSDGIA